MQREKLDSKKERFFKCPSCGSFNIKKNEENKNYRDCLDCGDSWYNNLI